MTRYNKTGRTRGLIFRHIRQVAALGRPITALDLPYSRHLATVYLRRLCREGELILIEGPFRGAGCKPTRYLASAALRPPEQTNRHATSLTHLCHLLLAIGYSLWT